MAWVQGLDAAIVKVRALQRELSRLPPAPPAAAPPTGGTTSPDLGRRLRRLEERVKSAEELGGLVPEIDS